MASREDGINVCIEKLIPKQHTTFSPKTWLLCNGLYKNRHGLSVLRVFGQMLMHRKIKQIYRRQIFSPHLLSKERETTCFVQRALAFRIIRVHF